MYLIEHERIYTFYVIDNYILLNRDKGLISFDELILSNIDCIKREYREAVQQLRKFLKVFIC
jgi:hypothetical protein